MNKLDTGMKLVLALIGMGILIMTLGYFEIIRGGSFGLLLVICGVIAFICHCALRERKKGIRFNLRYDECYDGWLQQIEQVKQQLEECGANPISISNDALIIIHSKEAARILKQSHLAYTETDPDPDVLAPS